MFHDFINDDIYIDPDGYPRFFQTIRFNGENIAEIKMLFPEYDCNVGTLPEEWKDAEPSTYGLKQIDLNQIYCIIYDGFDTHTVPVGGYLLRGIGEWCSYIADQVDSVRDYSYICSCADLDTLNSNFIERSVYIERLISATNEAWNRNARK